MALILLDGLADALCLMMMLRLAGRRIRLLRVFAAAALGALTAQAVRFCGFTRTQGMLLWLPAAFAMAGIASGCWRLRQALLLLSCEGLLGGTVQAVAGATGSRGAAWVLGVAAVCVMARSALEARRRAPGVRTVCIHVTYAGRTAALDAMVDSGNCLLDYLTHRPVIVMPDAARALFGLEGAILRPIFADTAGGRQMMDCFTPCSTVIEMDGRRMAVRACAAFSPGLSRQAPVLLPQSLLEQGEGETERADIEGDAYGKAKG